MATEGARTVPIVGIVADVRRKFGEGLLQRVEEQRGEVAGHLPATGLSFCLEKNKRTRLDSQKLFATVDTGKKKLFYWNEPTTSPF